MEIRSVRLLSDDSAVLQYLGAELPAHFAVDLMPAIRLFLFPWQK
jgi:hypothetical protein